MDDGVAYMVMGEGDMSQATQMVAIDNGDGTQQYAIPVMDPETGQETYMIIDPQTAQNFANGNGGQQFMVVDQETGMAEMMSDPSQMASVDDAGFTAMAEGGDQENIMVMKGEDSGGNIMVMLPNGEQGMVVAGEDLQNHGLEGLVQGGDKEQMYVVTSTGLENQNNGAVTVTKEEFMSNGGGDQDFTISANRNSVTKEEFTADEQALFNGFDPTPVVSEPVRSVHNISLGTESSMIRIVGIQDKVVRPQVSVVKSVGNANHTSLGDPYDLEADLVRQPVRAPRKQSLGTVSDFSQDDGLSSDVPPGLTGDIFKDTELVEAKVREICKKINMTEQEKEKLRLNLMTKGLDSVQISTGGYTDRAPMRGRGRGAAARISRPPAAKVIKCDQCGKGFPANVDESVLVHHIKTAHMVKPPQETFMCDKCEKKMPTATALKYHTCSERFQCPDCNKLFMQKSTLVEHQAVAHRPKQATPPPPNPVVIESKVEIPEFKPEPEKSKVEVIKKPREISSLPVEVVKKPVEEIKKPAEVIKKLVDDWDEDEEDEDLDEITGDNVPSVTGDNGLIDPEAGVISDVPEENKDIAMELNTVSDSLRPSVDKSEELDEDQIVADVDDILNDTDNIINDVDSILSGKTFKRKHDISDKSFLTDAPKLSEDDSIIKTLVDKKRATVQCEECYECFEDQEKLAWHSLNDH